MAINDLKYQVLAREVGGTGTINDLERKFWQESLDSNGSVPLVKANGNLVLDIDNDNDTTTATFKITKDAEATELLRVQEDGKVSIGGAPVRTFTIVEANSTFAIYENANDDVRMGTESADPISIMVGGSRRLTVNSTSVGVSTATPDASSALDITSTTRGFLPPRMTTTQRDAVSAPAEGLVIYNTTTKVLEFYNGTVWGGV